MDRVCASHRHSEPPAIRTHAFLGRGDSKKAIGAQCGAHFVPRAIYGSDEVTGGNSIRRGDTGTEVSQKWCEISVVRN